MQAIAFTDKKTFTSGSCSKRNLLQDSRLGIGSPDDRIEGTEYFFESLKKLFLNLFEFTFVMVTMII